MNKCLATIIGRGFSNSAVAPQPCSSSHITANKRLTSLRPNASATSYTLKTLYDIAIVREKNEKARYN